MVEHHYTNKASIKVAQQILRILLDTDKPLTILELMQKTKRPMSTVNTALCWLSARNMIEGDRGYYYDNNMDEEWTEEAWAHECARQLKLSEAHLAAYLNKPFVGGMPSKLPWRLSVDCRLIAEAFVGVKA